MKKYAVIVAGGSGTRMGTAVPKQFLLVHGKPIVYYTLQTFLNAYPDLQLILVLPSAFFDKAAEITAQTSGPQRIQLCEGGITRFHSVKNGLQYTQPGSVIFVHDGVRCLVSTQLIQRCYEQALKDGSAIPAVPVTDSIRKITGTGTEAVDRSLLRAIQTPQTFRDNILLPAFEQEYNDGFTDEATVAEAAGFTVHLIEGEKENIKITYPGDIATATKVLETRFIL